MWSHTLAAFRPVSFKAASTASRSIAPMGSTPSNPASFIARNFWSTEPFTPIVEYIIALRRFRFGAAEEYGVKAVAAAAVVATFIVILTKDRRFIRGLCSRSRVPVKQ